MTGRSEWRPYTLVVQTIHPHCRKQPCNLSSFQTSKSICTAMKHPLPTKIPPPLSTKKKQHSSSNDDINDNSEIEAWPSKASNDFINPSLSKTCIHIRTLYLHPLVHLCCCEVCNLPAFSIAQRETATDASEHQDYMIRYVTRCKNRWMQCKHEIMTFF